MLDILNLLVQALTLLYAVYVVVRRFPTEKEKANRAIRKSGKKELVWMFLLKVLFFVPRKTRYKVFIKQNRNRYDNAILPPTLDDLFPPIGYVYKDGVLYDKKGRVVFKRKSNL